MRTSLTRRNFLRAGGVAIALPMMESLSPLAQAADGKKAVKRMVCLSNNYGVYQKAFFPTKGGSDYEMSPTLQPLAKHRKDFSVFSNLDHGLTGGHACVPTFLNGIRPDMSSSFPEGNISMDQKAAEFVGAATRYPSMTLKVKESNQTSFTRTGVQVPSIDVTAMYRKLFLEDTPDARKQERLRLKRHGSILDSVLDKAKAVNRELGKQDQQKFAEYLDSVRSLEKKIDLQEPWLDRPKPKTELEEPRPQPQTADEMKIMMELMALAIETDSTRIMTLSSGFANGDFGLQGGVSWLLPSRRATGPYRRIKEDRAQPNRANGLPHRSVEGEGRLNERRNAVRPHHDPLWLRHGDRNPFVQEYAARPRRRRIQIG